MDDNPDLAPSPGTAPVETLATGRPHVMQLMTTIYQPKTAALTSIFQHYIAYVECVWQKFYSVIQAQVLGAEIDCIVGMNGAIGDDAARSFAIRFYGALGSGRSVANAVAQGVATLAAKQLPDEILPRCVTRDGIDPNKLILGQHT